MEKLLKDTLVLLGLQDKEIAFFDAAFTIGPATIQQITKESRLERSTAYLIAQNLIEKGLIEEDFKNYKKTLIAAEPKKLLRMLAARQRVVKRQELELMEKLPELQSVYKASTIRPTVKVFQGKSALLSIWEDILKTKNGLLLWTNQETESLVFTREFHERFIRERIQKKIPIRVLAVNNDLGKKLLENDALSLRQSRLLPVTTSFSAETYIYDNKIAMLDYKKDIIGIIIESEPIASSSRAIFEMAWEKLT